MASVKEYRSDRTSSAVPSGAADHGPVPALFDRPEWLDAMHRHCLSDLSQRIISAREGDAQVHLHLAENGPGALIAMANFYSFSWRPLISGDPHALARRRLVAAMARDLRQNASHVELYPVLAGDGSLDLLLNAFRDAGWIAIARAMGCNHLLRLHGRSFAEYWATRPGPLRSTVQRKGPRNALRFDIHHKLDDALWADYLAVYSRSWKPEEGHVDFLRAIAEWTAQEGGLRLGFARLPDGTPVATQFWTVEGRTALIHKLAHDAAFDRESPGTLLSHHMFAQAIDGEHIATIDYGTGDNSYKRDWMEESRPLYRVDCYDPTRPSSWLPAARTAISRLVGPRHRR